MQIDPMSHFYPGISTYAYAMNNPLLYIDLTGETVECTTEEDCEKAAADINELHKGAGVEVVEKQRTKEKRFLGFLWKTGDTETETYYELTTGVEGYDWSEGGSNEYGLALYDVLATTENVFVVTYSEMIGSNSESYNKYDGQGYGGGKSDTHSGGADIQIDPRGYLETGEPSSIILMHELVGHTHPVATAGLFDNNAHDINRFYHPRVGIQRATYRTSHRGYKPEDPDRVIWNKKNLFKNR
jgi:hypothetical protein